MKKNEIEFIDFVKEAIKYGWINEKDIVGNTLLHMSARRGDLETVKYLVEQGADIYAKDHDGETALDIARLYEHQDVVEYLRLITCDLLCAIEDNNLQALVDFVESGGNVNIPSFNKKTTLLMHAAFLGCFEIVKYLVEQGADIHAKEYNEETALDIARSHDHKDIVEYLEEIQKKGK